MVWLLVLLGIPAGMAAVMASVGARLPQSHTSVRRARFLQPPEALFAAVSDVDNYAGWRPELKGVERLPDRSGRTTWREIGKQGRITFEITESEPPRRLVTSIADPDQPFGGQWIFEIVPAEDGSVLTITENGEVYNPIFRFLSRFVFGHGTGLEQYLKALGKHFGEQVRPERAY